MKTKVKKPSMRSITIFALLCAISLLSAGCAPATKEPVAEPTVQTDATVPASQPATPQPGAGTMTSSLPTLGQEKQQETQAAAPEQEASEPTAEDENIRRAKALASTFLDKPLQELIDALGEPLYSEYAPSCLGQGEDGELTYNGFTVYTYREDDNEVVRGVY